MLACSKGHWIRAYLLRYYSNDLSHKYLTTHVLHLLTSNIKQTQKAFPQHLLLSQLHRAIWNSKGCVTKETDTIFCLYYLFRKQFLDFDHMLNWRLSKTEVLIHEQMEYSKTKDHMTILKTKHYRVWIQLDLCQVILLNVKLFWKIIALKVLMMQLIVFYDIPE